MKLKKFIVLQPYYANKIYIDIVKGKSAEEVWEEYDNNVADPIVLELDAFQKSYNKALKEAK